MGNGKHGKSWNYRSSLSRPGKLWNFKSVGHAKPWKIKYFGKFCICKLRKQGKDAYNQEALSRKRPNSGYGEMWNVMIEILEKSWNF